MKQLFTILILTGLGTVAVAQTTETSADNNRLLRESRRLFTQKEYPALLGTIHHIDNKSIGQQTRQEIEYMRAVATFATNPLEGRSLMLQYLDDYPESAKRDILSAYIAESYYFTHNFEQAGKWFEQADLERLGREDEERAQLYHALTAQERGNEEFARHLLNSLKFTSKRYSSDAIFHLAAIDYYKGDIRQAYEGFKSIEFDDKYYLEIPYYLGGIYLKNKEYVRAEKLAQAFLKDNSDKRQGIPMQQILGAAYFGQRRYNEAIAPLKRYIEEYPEPQRIAYYQLAMSYFETGNYSQAVPLFDKCTDDNDILAQNAYLHIGIIELKFNDIAKARLAFEQAATMDSDSHIREEALYNYALCIHQTRYSPFAESVKVFERFLNEYPHSPHARQVGQYLIEVYMNTRNYDTALQSINKIQHPSDEIKEAKQKILYRMGVQAFIDNDMPKAIDYMNQSVTLARYNKETHSDALYWRGEAYYRMGNYKTAAADYRAVLSLSPRNSADAFYGLAYTSFNNGDYNTAANDFNRFLQRTGTDDSHRRADAYNRIGDCLFYSRDYNSAEEYYRKASETDKSGSDYSLYRTALAQGLQKDYTGKIATLNNLINNHPQSSYAEQAYYELGRAYIELDKNNDAVETFSRFIKRYPKSSLARRAATETAMIYNQAGDHSKAISTYKQIIREYPQSEEAQIAVQDLKNIYIEQGKVNEFAAFAASTPGMKAIESSERDTLTYIAAEKTYSRQRYDEAREAFQNYLKEFPQGSFTLDSHYYLGIIYYNQKAPKDAIAHFEQVIAYPDNKYSEDAMAYTSELLLNDGKYREAMTLYEQLAEKTDNAERRMACRMNIMRCAHTLGENKIAAEAATKILSDENISPEWKREAHYTRAKSLIASGESSNAVKDLATLATDTRTKQGAEAKYMLAQHYYDTKEHEKCEKEILEYIETGTPHSYWMARSFILLSDLYTTLGRQMEAKQYLLTLQNNYSGNDDISTLIKERMNKIAAQEKKSE